MSKKISEKVQIRKKTIDALINMDKTKRERLEEDLSSQLITYIQEEKFKSIGFYYGFHPEIDTLKIMEKIFELTDSSLYLPRIEPNYGLSFRLYNEGDALETVQRKIKQPFESALSIPVESIELLIVPGVAFQQNGYRVGFGGGYYDRALENNNLNTVSIIFDEQVYPSGHWQVESHDIPIKRLIMPKGSYK